MAALTLPAVMLFTQHALGDRVQGNWPAVIYPAAAIAAGGLSAPIWRRMLPPSIALGLGITLLVYLQAGTALLPVPAGVDPIARQLAGWDTLAVQVDAVRRQAGADFVAADQYGVAAELARTLPRGRDRDRRRHTLELDRPAASDPARPGRDPGPQHAPQQRIR